MPCLSYVFTDTPLFPSGGPRGTRRGEHFFARSRRKSVDIGPRGAPSAPACATRIFLRPLRWRWRCNGRASDAPLEKSSSPRPPRGKSIEILCFSYFFLARRAERNLPPLYHVFSFRPLAAPPGPAPIIPPFNVVSPMRGFGASAKRGEKWEK